MNMGVGVRRNPPPASFAEHRIPEAPDAGSHLIESAHGWELAISAAGAGIFPMARMSRGAETLSHQSHGLMAWSTLHPNGDIRRCILPLATFGRRLPSHNT